MANEKRLIDANALMDTVEGVNWYHIDKMGYLAKGANSQDHTPIYKAEDIYSAIRNAPTVDAVVLPCEIGREVFYIWSVMGDIGVENFKMSIGKVSSLSIQRDGVWAYCRYEDGLSYWHKVLDDFGRVVFLTREEAEMAIAKMDGDGNG